MTYKQQIYFLQILSVGKSKMKVSAEAVSGEGPFLIDATFSLYLHVLEG